MLNKFIYYIYALRNCFHASKMTYVAYWIIFFIFYLLYEIPAPQDKVWKFYFPIKSMLIVISIIFANIQFGFIRIIKREKYYWGNIIVVIAISFLFGLIIPSIIVQKILNETGLDLWFLIS